MSQEEQTPDVIVVDENVLATMTEQEQDKYFDELLMSNKTFIWKGVKYIYDSNIGPISWSW